MGIHKDTTNYCIYLLLYETICHIEKDFLLIINELYICFYLICQFVYNLLIINDLAKVLIINELRKNHIKHWFSMSYATG